MNLKHRQKREERSLGNLSHLTHLSHPTRIRSAMDGRVNARRIPMRSDFREQPGGPCPMPAALVLDREGERAVG